MTEHMDQQEMELPLQPIGDHGTPEYRLRKRLTKVRQSLERLTAATGMLPARDNMSVQDKEFNEALSEGYACPPGGDAGAGRLTVQKSRN